MKRELWPKVKAGSWVIYADEDAGVHKAKVTEVDIKLYEPGEPSRWGHPYGLTKDTGAVKIRYDETEIIENLADLVTYGATKFRQLRQAWEKWQAVKASADSYEEAFQAMRQEFRAY